MPLSRKKRPVKHEYKHLFPLYTKHFACILILVYMNVLIVSSHEDSFSWIVLYLSPIGSLRKLPLPNSYVAF